MRTNHNLLILKKHSVKMALAVLASLLLTTPAANALTYKMPSSGKTIGEVQEIHADSGDTLLDLARKHDIGVYDMVQANPHLNHAELHGGTKVIIPSEFKLPSGPHEGIVLNLAEMRVYHFRGDEVDTYPVGIGRQGWSTPTGETTIVSKVPHPDWHPTPSIKREAAMKGKHLPDVIPAGPHNPLGQYCMHLGFTGIMMHGTNAPHSVGLRSSHGCIRMYADDIAQLFSRTSVGTPVRIVYEPS